MPLDEGFGGEALDESVWAKDGTNGPLHTVRDGSLRLIATGQTNYARVSSRRSDFNFFERPLVVVWDLVP